MNSRGIEARALLPVAADNAQCRHQVRQSIPNGIRQRRMPAHPSDILLQSGLTQEPWCCVLCRKAQLDSVMYGLRGALL